MSGAEAFAVLAVIATVITIVDGAKQVYDAVGDAHGLPAAFGEVSGRLPIVRDTLSIAHHNIKAKDVDEESCKTIKPIIEACEKKAKFLDGIFRKVLPPAEASRLERYKSALKTLGKGNRVEQLMKGMLEDVQLLANQHGMKTVTKDDVDNIAKAILEVSKVPASMDEHLLHDTTSTYLYQGSGDQTIYQAQRDQYVNPGDGSQYNAHTQNFGKVQMKIALAHVQTLNLLSSSVQQDSELLKAIQEGSLRLEAVQRVGSHLSKIEEDCLQSLAFTGLGERQRRIIRPLANTCEWLPKYPKFVDWTQRHNLDKHFGLLWLKAGPGAGKSTLMNEAYLAASGRDSSSVTAGYFASEIGDELQRSSFGLIRTILLQILPKHRVMLTNLVQIYQTRKAEQGLAWQWTAEELLAFMEKQLIQSGGTALYIFVDGLEKFAEKEARELVVYFRKLTLSASASGAGVNVCLSSTYYPNIEAELCSEIKIESENGGDINSFVGASLFEGRTNISVDKEPFAREIIKRALGNFLWVVVVVAGLNEDLDKGRSMQRMWDRLQQTSREIDNMYARQFADSTTDDVDEILRFWQCISFAARPLNLAEFLELFAWSANPPPASMSRWLETNGQDLTDRTRVMKNITTLSRGLVDVRLRQAPMTRIRARPAGLQDQRPPGSPHKPGHDLSVEAIETGTESRTRERTDGHSQHPEESKKLSGQVGQNMDTLNNNTGKASQMKQVTQGIDGSRLLGLIDRKKGIDFHFTADFKPEAAEPGSRSPWRTFLEGPWKPVPLDPEDLANYNLEVIHDSVRDFFVKKNGFDSLNGNSSTANPVRDGHYTIARACYTYLSMPELRVLPDLVKDYLEELNFPEPEKFVGTTQFRSLMYAFKFFGYHARETEKGGVRMDFLLVSPLSETAALVGRWSDLPGSPTMFNHHDIRNNCSHYTTRLHFLCGEGLFRTAEHYLQSTKLTAEEINMRDRLGKTPLFYTVGRARLFKSDDELASFIHVLTRKGANANTITNSEQTLLVEAVKEKLLASTDALIGSGADVNVTDRWNITPLEQAISEGSQNLDLITLLLSRRAKAVRRNGSIVGLFLLRLLFPDWVSDGFDRCALHNSMLISSPDVINLLLQHVTAKEVKPKGAAQLIGAALERGRYDCLVVLLRTPLIRKLLTKNVVASTRETLVSQNEIVASGARWKPRKIWGIQIGASVPNTFNANEAKEASDLLDEISHGLGSLKSISP